MASAISLHEIDLPPGCRIMILPVAETDAPVLDALGAVWQAIRAQLAGAPPVAFNLQPGRSSSCGTIEWDTAPIIVLNLKDTSGRNLPARDILFLLQHLAAHAASRDATGSENRYHSADFADAASTLGLNVSERIPGIGSRPESLARGTLTRYQGEIRRLRLPPDSVWGVTVVLLAAAGSRLWPGGADG